MMFLPACIACQPLRSDSEALELDHEQEPRVINDSLFEQVVPKPSIRMPSAPPPKPSRRMARACQPKAFDSAYEDDILEPQTFEDTLPSLLKSGIQVDPCVHPPSTGPTKCPPSAWATKRVLLGNVLCAMQCEGSVQEQVSEQVSTWTLDGENEAVDTEIGIHSAMKKPDPGPGELKSERGDDDGQCFESEPEPELESHADETTQYESSSISGFFRQTTPNGCSELQYLTSLSQNKAQECHGKAPDLNWACLHRGVRHAWPTRRARAKRSSNGCACDGRWSMQATGENSDDHSIAMQTMKAKGEQSAFAALGA